MTPRGITTSQAGTAALRVPGARQLAVLGERVRERVVGGGRAEERGEARLEVVGGRPILMLGGAHRPVQMGAGLGAELLVGGRLRDLQTVRGAAGQANGGRDSHSTPRNSATYLIWVRASLLCESVVVIYL